MYQPETYLLSLSFMILTMLCWGSWANTMKLAPGYAFQLFYWDYVIGIVAGSLVWGLTLGNWGGGGLSFLSNIHQADTRHYAVTNIKEQSSAKRFYAFGARRKSSFILRIPFRDAGTQVNPGNLKPIGIFDKHQCKRNLRCG